MSNVTDKQRKVLGRGLSALLPARTMAAAPAPAAIDSQRKLPIDAIQPNPLQPRVVFQADRLEELAASIRSNGIIQPLIVRRHNGQYQLVAGERRWRAARLAYPGRAGTRRHLLRTHRHRAVRPGGRAGWCPRAPYHGTPRWQHARVERQGRLHRPAWRADSRRSAWIGRLWTAIRTRPGAPAGRYRRWLCQPGGGSRAIRIEGKRRFKGTP